MLLFRSSIRQPGFQTDQYGFSDSTLRMPVRRSQSFQTLSSNLYMYALSAMSGVIPGNFKWEPSYSLGLVELKSSLYLAHNTCLRSGSRNTQSLNASLMASCFWLATSPAFFVSYHVFCCSFCKTGNHIVFSHGKPPLKYFLCDEIEKGGYGSFMIHCHQWR